MQYILLLKTKIFKMTNLNTFNLSREIISPLSQFEIRDLLSLDAPILGNLHFSITNIGLYLTITTIIVFMLYTLATNYELTTPNAWSLTMESIYATVFSIVTNQINANKGQMFFPLIIALFIYILMYNKFSAIGSK